MTSIRVLKNPKQGQKYFYIGCSLGVFAVKEDIYAGDTTDEMRLNHYNMFEFSRDAEIILKEINKIFKNMGDSKV